MSYINVLAASKSDTSMMHVAILISLFIFLNSNAQKLRLGTYHDQFGSKLLLKSDKTFEYEWNFDLASSWSVGSWSVVSDTLYLVVTPIFDTLRRTDSSRTYDSLVLSSNLTSDVIDSHRFIGNLLSGGGQGRRSVPSKLVLYRRRLYFVGQDGYLMTKKYQHPLTGNQVDPWFELVRPLK